MLAALRDFGRKGEQALGRLITTTFGVNSGHKTGLLIESLFIPPFHETTCSSVRFFPLPGGTAGCI